MIYFRETSTGIFLTTKYIAQPVKLIVSVYLILLTDITKSYLKIGEHHLMNTLTCATHTEGKYPMETILNYSVQNEMFPINTSDE